MPHVNFISMPIHTPKGDRSSRILAVQPPEYPQLEKGIHGHWNYCDKYIDGRFLCTGTMKGKLHLQR
jgi:hypothetical protein